MSKAYEPLNKTPYYLHAIVVHDGNATSGHYFVYIFDWHKKVWHKFNDMQVKEVPEEEGFQHSNGAFSWYTAHWVVYIDEDTK